MFDKLRDVVMRDYAFFSGIALEGYFRQKFVEEERYSRMGAWWDRKGENEIDLVCENEFENRIDFYEVKRDSKRFSMEMLAGKSEFFFQKNEKMRSHKVAFKGLSLNEM